MEVGKFGGFSGQLLARTSKRPGTFENVTATIIGHSPEKSKKQQIKFNDLVAEYKKINFFS